MDLRSAYVKTYLNFLVTFCFLSYSIKTPFYSYYVVSSLTSSYPVQLSSVWILAYTASEPQWIGHCRLILEVTLGHSRLVLVKLAVVRFSGWDAGIASVSPCLWRLDRPFRPDSGGCAFTLVTGCHNWFSASFAMEGTNTMGHIVNISLGGVSHTRTCFF